VTLHHQFKSAEESLAFFHWRNDQYFGYIERMPVAGFDGKAVLDFGCGPGHDVIGFAIYSSPARLVAADISPASGRGSPIDFVRGLFSRLGSP
jgi:SAM-dependent methyltransferase